MFSRFREIWCGDFEYGSNPENGRPLVRCFCARELFSGRRVQVWEDEVLTLGSAPIPTDEGVLFVAHSAQAEADCFLELRWPVPRCILDTKLEFQAIRNGHAEYEHKELKKPKQKYNLLAVQAHYGVAHIDATEKQAMRDLAIRGGPYTEQERANLLAYCMSDCDALIVLLPKMEPDLRQFQWHEILHRGRYTIALARMGRVGIPLIKYELDAIRANLKTLSKSVVDDAITQGCDVFTTKYTFSHKLFREWTVKQGIRWPAAGGGKLLSTSDKTFKRFAEAKDRNGARRYPLVAVLRRCRETLKELKAFDLPCDSDGRHRVYFNPMATLTGRNMPGNSIFAQNAWKRYLIGPPEGHGIAYLDFESQEYAIAAAVSGDPNMIADYDSGDPYIRFAWRAGEVPENATKKTHKKVRDLYKVAALAISYGMTRYGLAPHLKVSEEKAEEIIAVHENSFPQFHHWRNELLAKHTKPATERTILGWAWWSGGRNNPRTLMDFPMQGIGADITRLAVIMATESGIDVATTAHDGLVIVAPLDRLDADVERMGRFMRAASQRLIGLTVRAGVEAVVRWPYRFNPGRPQAVGTWELIRSELERLGRYSGRELQPHE